MHVIIVGCGNVGSRLAHRLAAQDHNVVVVDNDPRQFHNLGTAFNGLTVTGNAIDVETLRGCGIERAKGFAAVTSNDNVNIMAAQIAQSVFAVPRVVARVNNPDREHVYHEFGLTTVSVTELAAGHIENRLLAGFFVPYGDVGDNLVQIEFTVGNDWAGRPLGDLEKPGLLRVQAILTAAGATIPHDKHRLEAGERLVGVAVKAKLDHVRQHLGLPRSREGRA